MNRRSLGDRMKENYEDRYRTFLTRRTPVIMRLDGRAFHTLTRGCEKPFDEDLNGCVQQAALAVLKEVQGAKCAYLQSDEISILITDFDRLDTEAWFDYNVQKMCSIAAAICSVEFSSAFGEIPVLPPYIHHGYFDCRVFNIPKAEVCNYFIWRQKDWERNSLHMFARSHFSHKELHEKGRADIHEMLHGIGENWADLPPKWKNGVYIADNFIGDLGKWIPTPAPIFMKHRFIIEDLLVPKEE